MNSGAKSNDPFYMDVIAWAMLLLQALVWGDQSFFLTLLIPPVAITLGHLFLGEVINANAWSGFFVIALGFATTDGRLFRIRK